MANSRLSKITILFVLELLIGCNTSEKNDTSELTSSSSAETSYPSHSDMLDNATDDNLDIIRSPDTVVVKRIESTLDSEKSLTQFKALKGKQLEVLQSLLVDPENYGWDYAKACETNPGVLLLFSKGAKQLEIRLCFECLMIGFKPGHWEDFDPIEEEMIAWVKTVYPDDEVIQSLE